MKKNLFILFISLNFFTNSQEDFLPKGLAEHEQKSITEYLSNYIVSSDVITDPPTFNVRTMAEWEEIQALTIAWEGYEPILTEIVRASVEECSVFIACDNEGEVQEASDYLIYNNVDLSNVEFFNVTTNSIWMRDYGQNTVYKDDVDSLYLVDWVYNRPNRPDDDTYPEFLANVMNIDLFQTVEAPNTLVHTGGNFMSDGFGTAFSSNLILDENDISEQQIDDIMNNFMGIDTYIKMETLPFDGIHHIDMHMKLLDEETLLVAEYPDGLSDGPQIEENLQYILNNFSTKWGTPYKVIRIPSPPSTSGAYPGSQPDLNNSIDGYYRTYTNSVFVNNTVIVPFYREEYDTVAQRIYEEALPGYNIVGIDCDNSGNNIIASSGAIHCITHSVGVDDPLLISYKKIEDCIDQSPYVIFQSLIKHKSGIQNAFFNYRFEGEDDFTSVSLQDDDDDDIWQIVMSFDDFNINIEYYVSAESNSGKFQVRPITAPNGFNSFFYGNSDCTNTYVEGCMDDLGCNFNPLANIDNGLCDFSCYGCTDILACNFEETATENLTFELAINLGLDANDVCSFAESGVDCDGNCLVDLDEDGICDDCMSYEMVVVDCECTFIDPATYTVFFSNVNEEDCIITDDCYCECYNDLNMNGICDENENSSLSEIVSGKQLVKVTDILGRQINSSNYIDNKSYLLYIYDNGSVEKIYPIK